jgi:hypothetical protein
LPEAILIGVAAAHDSISAYLLAAWIGERGNSTRLAYRLSIPETPGKAQTELGILAEASYVISVRTPPCTTRTLTGSFVPPELKAESSMSDTTHWKASISRMVP